jgi:hypothetical protein
MFGVDSSRSCDGVFEVAAGLTGALGSGKRLTNDAARVELWGGMASAGGMSGSIAVDCGGGASAALGVLSLRCGVFRIGVGAGTFHTRTLSDTHMQAAGSSGRAVPPLPCRSSVRTCLSP